jgi:hypothetical protein
MALRDDDGGTRDGNGGNGNGNGGNGNGGHTGSDDRGKVAGDKRCHCQGSRLLVLLGPLEIQTDRDGKRRDPATGAFLVEDATMYLAQHWALNFYADQRDKGKHIHMLAYEASAGAADNVREPRVPVHNANAPETVMLHGTATTLAGTSWSWKKREQDNLEETIPKCCCFFKEVMLIFHGHQAGAYTFIMDSLRLVLAGRPVETLVLWTCESSERFSPNRPPAYQRITWLVRPKMCACGCLPDQCNAFDPDCTPRHCPDGTKPTHILTSGHVNGKPVKLGINPSAANPLSSPDGRLREIAIFPGPTASGDQATATMSGVGPTFFDDLVCGTDPTLLGPGGAGAPNPAAVTKYEDDNLKNSPIEPIPGKQEDYVGPKTSTSHCDAAQGCMTGANCNGPDSPP